MNMYEIKIISKLKSNGLNDKFPLYLTFELLINQSDFVKFRYLIVNL